MAHQLDRLQHRDKTDIINDLEAQERELVHQGKAAPPPLSAPAPSYLSAPAVTARRTTNTRLMEGNAQ